MTGRTHNTPPLTEKERREWFWGSVLGIACALLFAIGMFL